MSATEPDQHDWDDDDWYDDEPEPADPLLATLVREEVLTAVGVPRCQVAAAAYGAGRCEGYGSRILMTAMVASHHLVISACERHAEELLAGPGNLHWAMKL